MPHSVIVREGEARSRGPASGTGQPALAGTPAAPLPADATGPIPLPAGAAGPIGHREQASSFSLTGRHRLGPVTPQNGTVPGRDYGLLSGAHDGPLAGLAEPAEPAGAASPGRGPWDPAQPGPAEPAAPPPRPGLARRHPSPAAETHRGLPRRVRQASIAPQLRDRAPAEPGAAGRMADPVETRSPDEARDLFSSLQQGWQRGRVDDLDYPDDGPGEWPGGRPGGSPDSGNGEAL